LHRAEGAKKTDDKPMGLKKFRNQFGLRMERLERQFRARAAQRQLTAVADRTQDIRRSDILLFSTLRNERPRLDYFLDYYKSLGVRHFLFVDNGSTDGSREFLAADPRCSVWTTQASYKRAGYGIDWLNGLQSRYGNGHWVLVVDVDEFLVYPYMDSRPLKALTEWLDASRRRSLGAMLIDMYSDRPIAHNVYRPGDNPLDTLCWFDAANYAYQRNGLYRNLWIQGGPRQRVFFADKPELAPALNKIPLVKWFSKAVYVSSTHTLLPRGLNQVYEERGGEKVSGALLHAKLLSGFAEKAEEEIARGQHYAASREYRVYSDKLEQQLDFWTPFSTRYTGWRQLDDLGLISTGAWA